MHGQPSSPIRDPWLRDARTADGCSAPMSSAPVWTPQIRTGARVTPGRSLRGCRGGRGLRAGRMRLRVPTSSAPPAPPACHRQPTNRGLAPVALDRWPRPAPSPLASSAMPCGRSVHHRAVVQQADTSARCRPRSCVAPGQRRREALGPAPLARGSPRLRTVRRCRVSAPRTLPSKSRAATRANSAVGLRRALFGCERRAGEREWAGVAGSVGRSLMAVRVALATTARVQDEIVARPRRARERRRRTSGFLRQF